MFQIGCLLTSQTKRRVYFSSGFHEELLLSQFGFLKSSPQMITSQFYIFVKWTSIFKKYSLGSKKISFLGQLENLMYLTCRTVNNDDLIQYVLFNQCSLKGSGLIV